MKECDNFSEDVKYWAEYKTGIKGFKPWLAGAEAKSTEGLSKPQTLDEANSMFANVKAFTDGCLKHLKVLEDAAGASLKMTTHKEADVEVAELKARYEKVKLVADEWMKKCDTLVKEWQLLDNTVTEVHSWRTQKYLQRDGKACGKSIKRYSYNYFIVIQIFISITTRLDIMLAFIL